MRTTPDGHIAFAPGFPPDAQSNGVWVRVFSSDDELTGTEMGRVHLPWGMNGTGSPCACVSVTAFYGDEGWTIAVHGEAKDVGVRLAWCCPGRQLS